MLQAHRHLLSVVRWGMLGMGLPIDAAQLTGCQLLTRGNTSAVLSQHFVAASQTHVTRKPRHKIEGQASREGTHACSKWYCQS